MYLEKRETIDVDLEDNYKVTFCALDSLGYMGSGDKIRGFDNIIFLDEIRKKVLNHELGEEREGILRGFLQRYQHEVSSHL